MKSDVLILGGGLAGAVAAAHLASRGVNVTLLEKEVGPHDKVCGEFLSAECALYLQEIGLKPQDFGARPLTRFCLTTRLFSVSRPLKDISWGWSRRSLDEACLRRAEALGARVFRGVLARGWERKNGLYEVASSQGPHQAPALFVATGKHDVPGHRRQGREAQAVGFKTRLARFPFPDGQDTIRLFFYPGGYAGFSGIEGGGANFCFIIDRKTCERFAGRWPDLLRELGRRNVTLRPLLDHILAESREPVATANIPYGFLQKAEAADPEVYPLGDQFAVIPSLAGSGMAIALHTAREAARSYLKDPHEGGWTFHRECALLIRRRMRLAYPLHRLSLGGGWREFALGVVKPFPFLIDRIIAATRLPGPRGLERPIPDAPDPERARPPRGDDQSFPSPDSRRAS